MSLSTLRVTVHNDKAVVDVVSDLGVISTIRLALDSHENLSVDVVSQTSETSDPSIHYYRVEPDGYDVYGFRATEPQDFVTSLPFEV